MKRSRAVKKPWLFLRIAIVGILLLVLSSVAWSSFPVDKGTVWVYQGKVAWQGENSEEVQEKNISWQVEVIESVERGGIHASLILGFPLDLVFYENGKQPGNYVIIQAGGTHYYLVFPTRADEVWKRILDQEDPLVDLVNESELFLDYPFVVGKTYGESAQITREDQYYVWLVSHETVETFQMKGISPQSKYTNYQLLYRTNSDDTTIDIVPEIGITRFQYNHHGTTSEVDLKLIEFRPAKRH